MKKRGWLVATAILFSFILHTHEALAKCNIDFEHNLMVAEAYEEGTAVPKDLEKSAQAYLKAASDTDMNQHAETLVKARHKMGMLYRDGTGISQNDEEAYFWFSLAAMRDRKYASDMEAMEGRLSEEKIVMLRKRISDLYGKQQEYYCTTRSGTRDESYRTAVPRLRPRAENGSALSQRDLAYYLNALESYKDAYLWSSLALRSCIDELCINWAKERKEVSATHLSPAEVSEQEERLKNWKPVHLALKSETPLSPPVKLHIGYANKGDAAHQYALGELYAGVTGDSYNPPRNMPEAYFWYAVAAKTEPDNKVYSSHRDAIKATLTPDQLNLVEGRIRTWKPE